METTILFSVAAVIIETIGILVFLKRVKNKMPATLIIAVFSFGLIGLQVFTTFKMLEIERVFEPPSPLIEESSIQNPSSTAIIPLLRKQDFSGNLHWVNVSMQQPSKFPWKDSPADSAESLLIAEVPRWLIFKHYVRVFHWDAIYDSPASEEEFTNRISTEEHETSFVPTVQPAGEHFYAMCHEGNGFYSCDLAIGYKNHISFLVVNTPQYLGKQFTFDLLNSAIETIDKRLK